VAHRYLPVGPGVRRLLSTAVFGGLVGLAGQASAQSKEVCLEAHGKGQDLREAGKISGAREQFLKCAQSACPALVQADCARFGEELQRMIPTVTFAARDGAGQDVVDTTVFVDNVQITASLSGQSYEVDPGPRVIRFVHAGKTVEQKVVISQGEKGRVIAVTFDEPAAAAPPQSAPPVVPIGGTPPRDPGTPPDQPRSSVPLVFMGIGGAALAAGVVVLIVGGGKIPESCDYFDKECAAPPGDPVFDEAKSGAGLINVGTGLAVAGGAVFLGSLIWYFAQPTARAPAPAATGLAPWMDHRSGGFSFRGAF
jgi:hypothetical protein